MKSEVKMGHPSGSIITPSGVVIFLVSIYPRHPCFIVLFLLQPLGGD